MNENKKGVKKTSLKDSLTPTQKVLSKIVPKNSSNTDPNGSYTGKPVNHWEKPTQDADDL